MPDKMYWAARCENCSGMVGNRDVRYILDLLGVKTEEKLPEETTRRRRDHCGAACNFELRQLRATPAKCLIPRVP